MADLTATTTKKPEKQKRKASDAEKLYWMIGAGLLLVIDLVWIFGYPALILIALGAVVLAFVAIILITLG